MTRTVLFDLDDTLLDFHKAEAVALAETLRRMGVEPAPETIALYSGINSDHWLMLERGEITREQLLTRRFRVLYDRLGLPQLDEFETQKHYEKLLGTGHFFMPGAPELLECLHDKYDLYLVSNGTASVQDGRIQSAGIAKYFKRIFISHRMGIDKPHKGFFDLCFAEMPDFDPARTIIIGDSLTSDIQGGRNAGISTCWYNPRHKAPRADIPADYEIADLAEIPALLEKFFA